MYRRCADNRFLHSSHITPVREGRRDATDGTCTYSEDSTKVTQACLCNDGRVNARSGIARVSCIAYISRRASLCCCPCRPEVTHAVSSSAPRRRSGSGSRWWRWTSMVIGLAKSSWGRRNGVVWDSGLRKGSAGFVWLGRAHGARDGSADGGHALGLGDVGGNAVEYGRAMPENGIDGTDPGRGNRPSLGTGFCGTALSLIFGGGALFHSIKCAEHPNWLIFGERAAWPEKGGKAHRATSCFDVGLHRRARPACEQDTRQRSGAA